MSASVSPVLDPAHDAPPASTPPSSPPPPSSAPPTYVVKRITFNGKRVPITLQNTNGPCPLLAVANILSLRGHFSIHEDKSVVTAEELLAAVSDYLFDANSATSDALQKNHERNVSDVIQMLPNTLVGIDVNLKFDTITSFEFNSDIILFDFCNVRLVHGWLVDPQDTQYAFIRNLSYNQLVERELERVPSTGMRSPPRTKLFVQGSPSLAKLNLNREFSVGNIAGPSDPSKMEKNGSNDSISKQFFPTTASALPPSDVPSSPRSEQVNSQSTSDVPDKVTQALLAEQFLNETATQLTYYGLAELHTGLREEELCVFFRNNHFNTLYKHNGELYVLVTDQGYAHEPIVWEKLCQIDGDSMFVRGDFTTYTASSPIISPEGIVQNHNESEDRDLALAMQLQDEENRRNPPPTEKHSKKEKKEHKEHKEKEKDKEHKEHCILQ